MTDEKIAEFCHEVNRHYSRIFMDDNSHKPWAEAPDWQKESAISGVTALREDPTLQARNIHELWMQRKLEAGWVYGEVKDGEKKQHPCILPYGELPEAQQMKDEIFMQNVKTLLYR